MLGFSGGWIATLLGQVALFVGITLFRTFVAKGEQRE
jgi:hypothetical protein